jgi:hypothetical protein
MPLRYIPLKWSTFFFVWPECVPEQQYYSERKASLQKKKKVDHFKGMYLKGIQDAREPEPQEPELTVIPEGAAPQPTENTESPPVVSESPEGKKKKLKGGKKKPKGGKKKKLKGGKKKKPTGGKKKKTKKTKGKKVKKKTTKK